MAEQQSGFDENTTNAHHQVAPQGTVTQKENSRVTRLDRWVAKKVFQALGSPKLNIQLWDGVDVNHIATASYRMIFTDRGALFKLLRNPEYQFGELYSARRIMIQGDLVEFIDMVYRSMRTDGRDGGFFDLVKRLRYKPKLNSLSGSKKNIHHHYNLSNDFYELWLDKEVMQYTCAYFPTPSMTLEEAQAEKLHHVARKLQLKEGQTVVEAGCGWGGLSRFFAKHYGVNVRAYNISSEQVAFARAKAKQQGLEHLIEYVEDDYRNITGKFDVFVSIGMLEHVGTAQYQTLGEVAQRSLKENGTGLIHSIGRNAPGLMNEWIEKRIFPGAYPPSIKEMMDIFEPNNLSVLDTENIRLHYAKTLEHWLQRFEDNIEEIKEMFDDSFIRAWRLYLAGSMAAFTAAELQLFQIVFTHAENNDISWSRQHVYQEH